MDTDTQSVKELLEEAATAGVTVVAAIEGYTHVLEQQDITSESRDEATEIQNNYITRKNLLKDVTKIGASFKEAILALLAHGHPEEPSADVHPDVLLDLTQNRDTINVALSRLRPRGVTVSGTFEGGPEEVL